MDIHSVDLMATGRRLKKLCQDRGVTATDLQTLLNLTSTAGVYKWFSGQNLPTIDNLVNIARYLDVTTEDILVMVGVEDVDEESRVP